MKLLVYCVLRAPARLPQPPPAGVRGARIEIVEDGRLAAVLSRGEEEPPGALGLTPILEFRDVVEAFARDATVLPVRYGAYFDREEHLRRFLEGERARLEQLMAELEGHVEMAVLVSSARSPEEAPSLSADEGGRASGQAYLAARRAFYARREQGQESAARLLERCRTAFAGLFTRSSAEVRPFALPAADSGGRPRSLVALSFLVPHGCVAEFRERYRTLAAAESAEFALSGPRPPYSFVALGPAPEGRSTGLSP